MIATCLLLSSIPREEQSNFQDFHDFTWRFYHHLVVGALLFLRLLADIFAHILHALSSINIKRHDYYSFLFSLRYPCCVGAHGSITKYEVEFSLLLPRFSSTIKSCCCKKSSKPQKQSVWLNKNSDAFPIEFLYKRLLSIEVGISWETISFAAVFTHSSGFLSPDILTTIVV